MRVFALALLLAAGCAQVPASPVAATRVVAADPVAETTAEPVTPPPEARALAAEARGFGAGLDLAQLEAQGQRARELRAELRGGYERALMRLRGQFTLPTAYRRDEEPTLPPGGWAPLRER